MAFTFIGTIIGAGFASGQEIRKYFVDYGAYGFFGIIFVSILFMVIGEKIMLMGYAGKSDSYDRILGYGFRCKFKKVIDFILCIFLIATAGVMFSGAGAFFNQVFGINPAVGSFFMMLVTFFVTIIGISRIMKISTVIVPILILITCIICASSIKDIDITKVSFINEVSSSGLLVGFISAIIYTAYNLIMSFPVLVTLGNSAKSKKQIRINSIFSGLVIGVLAIILFFALFFNYSDISGVEIPILSLTSSSGFLWYGISFVIAVFTTALGSLVGVYGRFNKNKLVFLGICIVAYIFSLFGFSNLIANLYFIMGMFGVFVIFMLLYGFYKSYSLGKVN